ncbi:hypothetical protein [Paraburkholderia sp. PGU19]|uniref:hypothetical protein n=1 Tax=Paraburkholderia sp. PGU19 TaxID=2735434 RepID=UPI0015DA3D35|nr:hypothetical protein [Paraburkholderia sp. PGU19]
MSKKVSSAGAPGGCRRDVLRQGSTACLSRSRCAGTAALNTFALATYRHFAWGGHILDDELDVELMVAVNRDGTGVHYGAVVEVFNGNFPAGWANVQSATNGRSASEQTCHWNGCIAPERDARSMRTVRL